MIPDVKAELLGTGHSAHGGTDCGNSFTSDDPLACGLAHLFGGAGAELLRHTAPCRSTLGTPGPGAAMGTPLGAAVLSGPAAGGILRDPRHDPRVAARAPHPGPHIPGLPTLLGMAFGGTGSWSLQAEGHEGPASPEQSSAKRPRLSTDNGTGAGSGAGTGAGAGAGMGAGAGWSLPPVLAPPRRLAGWIPVHVGASAGVTGGRPGSLAVDFGGGGGVGTGSGDSGGGGVDGGSTRSSAPACTGTPTALNSVPGGAPIGSQQPASTLDSRGTSSVVTLATPQPPILRFGPPASDSARFGLHFKQAPPQQQRQQQQDEGRQNVEENLRPSQRAQQNRGACVGTPHVAEEEQQEQQEQEQEQQEQQEQEQQQQEQQEQAEGRPRGRGRVARKAVEAGPPVDPAGRAAPHVACTRYMCKSGISFPSDMLQYLLPGEVLAAARQDLQTAKESPGTDPQTILKMYIVTVYARRPGGTAVPYKASLTPYPDRNFVSWRLARLYELRKYLQLPPTSSVRMVREVQEDGTVLLVLEPAGGPDGEVGESGAEAEAEAGVDAQAARVEAAVAEVDGKAQAARMEAAEQDVGGEARAEAAGPRQGAAARRRASVQALQFIRHFAHGGRRGSQKVSRRTSQGEEEGEEEETGSSSSSCCSSDGEMASGEDDALAMGCRTALPQRMPDGSDGRPRLIAERKGCRDHTASGVCVDPTCRGSDCELEVSEDAGLETVVQGQGQGQEGPGGDAEKGQSGKQQRCEAGRDVVEGLDNGGQQAEPQGEGAGSGVQQAGEEHQVRNHQGARRLRLWKQQRRGFLRRFGDDDGIGDASTPQSPSGSAGAGPVASDIAAGGSGGAPWRSAPDGEQGAPTGPLEACNPLPSQQGELVFLPPPPPQQQQLLPLGAGHGAAGVSHALHQRDSTLRPVNPGALGDAEASVAAHGQRRTAASPLWEQGQPRSQDVVPGPAGGTGQGGGSVERPAAHRQSCLSGRTALQEQMAGLGGSVAGGRQVTELLRHAGAAAAGVESDGHGVTNMGRDAYHCHPFQAPGGGTPHGECVHGGPQRPPSPTPLGLGTCSSAPRGEQGAGGRGGQPAWGSTQMAVLDLNLPAAHSSSPLHAYVLCNGGALQGAQAGAQQHRPGAQEQPPQQQPAQGLTGQPAAAQDHDGHPAGAGPGGGQAEGSNKNSQALAAIERQLQVAPVAPAASINVLHLPAASLTPATLCGYVASEQQIPPVRSDAGELRLCGLTFHPHVATDTRVALDTWLAALPGPLSEARPNTQQVYVGRLGEDVPEGHRAWVEEHAHVAAALREGQAAVERHGLSPGRIARGVASLLGWFREWDGAWPEGRLELEGMEPCRDKCRGGRGLRAVRRLAASSVVGVCGGYVMPGDLAKTFVARGFQWCGPEAKAELDRRAGRDRTLGWWLLAWAYMTEYGAGHKLCGLGYGNLAALANDPRVSPRAWPLGDGVEADEEGQPQPGTHPGANCAVVPVVARGLVLPVLVALRDIAAGEELLRDYGAAWWRQEDFAEAWAHFEEAGTPLEGILGVAGESGAPAV